MISNEKKFSQVSLQIIQTRKVEIFKYLDLIFQNNGDCNRKDKGRKQEGRNG